MSEHDRQRLARLERQMRENLLKRKALAKSKSRRDVADAARALDVLSAPPAAPEADPGPSDKDQE